MFNKYIKSRGKGVIMAFCPICGKKGIKGILCSECSIDKNKAIMPKKEIRAKLCGSCSSYLSRNKWTRYKKINDLLVNLVKEAISKGSSTGITPLIPRDFKANPGIKRRIDVNVDDSLIIPVDVEVTLCNKCSKQGTQYFEGVLQLRNPSDDVLDYLEKEVLKMSEKGGYITKQVKLKNGYDLYFTSNKGLNAFGKNLKTRFGGILKSAAKLQTRDKLRSRDLYRISVYYEPPPFSKGSILGIGEKVVKITSLGKQISGVDIVSGDKVSVNPDRDYVILKKYDVLVSKVIPWVEVLDPESYQGSKVVNAVEVKENTKVQIAKYKGKIYLI